MSKSYSITELAAEFDISTRTIRFYEEKGLIAPERKGNTRLYNDADRVRLKLILRGKRLGFSLEESRDIIDMYQPNQSNEAQIQKLIYTIRDKRKQLEQQKNDIEAMMVDLKSAEQQCLEALTTVQKQSQQ